MDMLEHDFVVHGAYGRAVPGVPDDPGRESQQRQRRVSTELDHHPLLQFA